MTDKETIEAQKRTIERLRSKLGQYQNEALRFQNKWHVQRRITRDLNRKITHLYSGMNMRKEDVPPKPKRQQPQKQLAVAES